MNPALKLVERAKEREEFRIGRITFPLIRTGAGRVQTWWMDGSERRQASAKDLPRLRAKLQLVANNILSGQIEANALEPADHRAYLAAREALGKYNIAVDAACREYAAARDKISGAPLSDAANFFHRYSRSGIGGFTRKTFAEAAAGFIQSKRDISRSESYLDQLEKDLGRASAHFQERQLSDITADDFRAYLQTIGHKRREKDSVKFVPASSRRRDQVVETFVTMFRWARKNRFLPDLKTEPESIEQINALSAGNPVYTPTQLITYLNACRLRAPEWLPWMVIGAFTGMRTGAILRLHWEAVQWDKEVIVVEARQSKIRKRYLAPMRPALTEWLAGRRGEIGRIAPPGKDALKIFTASLSRWTVMPWRKNALRSSFIAYRFAQCGDPAVVAVECNTSAEEVLSEYKNIQTVTGDLVTRELAETWFSIFPPIESESGQREFHF